MSIIYDALKRIETKTKGIKENFGSPKRNNSKFLRIVYILCILIIIGFIGFFMGKKPSISLPTSQTSPVKELSLPVQVKTSPALEKKLSPSGKNLPPLSLTGIFFSDGEYIALINNQMVKIGDFIEGVQIDKIDSNGVEIKFEGSSFRLNYP